MQISFKDKSPTIKTLFQKKILKIFLLGIISGFPWVLIGSSLSLWLKEDGLSRSSIGWAGLIFAIYAFNFLWAPLVDKIQIPWLSKKIGHRKSWIFLMQIIICICLFSWSLMNPTEHLYFIIFFGFLIALCSCTQDISIDALRIEQVNEGENKLIAAGASVAVIGWWTGFKLGGLLSLSISDYFSKIGVDNYWQITFILIIFLIVIFNLFLLKIEEKLHRSKQEYRKFEKYFRQNIFNSIIFEKYFTWLASTILIPIISFFKKNVFQFLFI